MNCLRSMKYIKQLDNYYRKFGLKIFIVHPPEWEFEKSEKNILSVLEKEWINYPLVVDKDKKIINKLNINFWPSQLLIKGNKVVYKNSGEGNYKKLEDSIRKFLNANGKTLFLKEPKHSRYPTLYAGKRKGLINKGEGRLTFGKIFIKGEWEQRKEYIKSKEKGCLLSLATKGKIVNFVAESLSKKPSKVKVKLNGRFVSTIKIKNPKLYRISLLRKKNNKLSLIVDKNLAIYSFSFQ